MSKKYNGWSNKNTWLTMIHFNPESLKDVEYIERYISTELQKIKCPFMKDVIDISDINYKELKKEVKSYI